jgi:hypothetical protein
MTLRTSAVAVCCCSDSRSSRVRRCPSIFDLDVLPVYDLPR